MTLSQGFGRFAAFNVLQLLGHHESFPFDTETVRLFREEKGVAKTVPSPKVRLARAFRSCVRRGNKWHE